MKVLWSPQWLGWLLWNNCVTNDRRYIPLVVNTSRSFPHSWLITWFVTRLTRRVPLVKQELLTLPEHMNWILVFSGVRVNRSLVVCVSFVDRCLSFFFWPLCCLFFFDLQIPITPLVSSNSSYIINSPEFICIFTFTIKSYVLNKNRVFIFYLCPFCSSNNATIFLLTGFKD